jgi:hypothetical protein
MWVDNILSIEGLISKEGEIRLIYPLLEWDVFPLLPSDIRAPVSQAFEC